MTHKIKIDSENPKKEDGGVTGEAPATEDAEKSADNGNGAAGESFSQPSDAPAAPGGDKAAEYLDMLRRMKAEFDNYKRRTAREKQENIRYAAENVLLKLLSVVDDLQRGISFARSSDIEPEILKGFELVEKQLLEILTEYGASPMECLNQPFDPSVHEPIYTLERDDVEDNTIVEEQRKGYNIHDKILRPPRVVVSRKPARLSQDES